MNNKTEWIEERAAIMEYDGGLPRLKAEREAARLYVLYMKRRIQDMKNKSNFSCKTD